MDMRKTDIAWIGIRLFGLFFFVQALVNLFDLCFAVYSVFSETPVSWGVNTEDRWNALIVVGVRLGALSALYLGLSFYFVTRGEFVHNLLMRVPGEDET